MYKRQVETPKTLKIRSGCEGGGKGALIQDNKYATLGCNCLLYTSGTCDLRTGAVREHNAQDYITKQTAVDPSGCLLYTSMPVKELQALMQAFLWKF